VTVSVYVAVSVPEDPVPVIVIGYVPLAVDELVANVAVDELPAVTELGLKDTVTPEGAPLALNATDCAEPEVTAVFTVAVVLEPAATDAEVGETETEKPFAGVVEPLVKGPNLLLKYQVDWEIPEHESEPPVPGHPPLSRSSAQNDRVLMPFDSAQPSTVDASASVKVSAAP
jgi:hypothetical protein